MPAAKTIGLYMHVGDDLERRRVDGILNYARENKLEIRSFNYRHSFLGAPSDVPIWRGKVDGMIVIVPSVPNIVPWLERGGCPYVNAATDLSRKVPSVFNDPRSLVQAAVDHLRELQLQNFAFIGYDRAYGSHLREKSFAQVLAKHKAQPHIYQTEQMLTGEGQADCQLADIEAGLIRFLKKLPKPAGILCVNDNWAASICAIAKKLGFSIPQELAVIGVDDSPITRESTPAITSVRISCEQIGYEAAKMVHQLILGKTLKQRVIKVPVLGIVERYSTVGVKRALATDITRALGYIREQACENIRIEDVAATVHVPLRTFELEFRDVVGHTVGTEIRRVRLNRVKLLLETTRLPLSTVARMVGLNDAAYLSKFFTRLTHLTPAQYRNQHQQKNTAVALKPAKKQAKILPREQAKRSAKIRH